MLQVVGRTGKDDRIRQSDVDPVPIVMMDKSMKKREICLGSMYYPPYPCCAAGGLLQLRMGRVYAGYYTTNTRSTLKATCMT